MEAHEAWGAAYVAGRRTNFGPEDPSTGRRASMAVDGVDGSLGGRISAFFLRGKSLLASNDRGDEEEEEEGDEEEGRRELQSSSSSWTTHTGPINDPIGGLSFANIEEYTAPAKDETEEELERQELRERLEGAKERTQALNSRHERYDTNVAYTYSDPGGAKNNDSDNDSNESLENMQQFSHTAHSSRQRLLTGSYAAWQWYDRSNLVAPSNLDLRKISRVNYAFFQSDAEGYVFGMDSWADPNVLFGEYEFKVSLRSARGDFEFRDR